MLSLARCLAKPVLLRTDRAYSSCNNLTTMTKLQSRSVKETFVNQIRTNPLKAYTDFYQNQFDSNHNRIIVKKLIYDINSRLVPSSIMHNPRYSDARHSLEKTRKSGMDVLEYTVMRPEKIYSFVINYLESMYGILCMHDPTLKETYHTNFAKDFLDILCKPCNNTAIFFTFENMDQQYLIDIRPACIYPVQLLDLPNFSFNAASAERASNKPLIPSKYVKKSIEGNVLHFREVSFHDLGHAHVMNRQDDWLFRTCNAAPFELVAEWVRNKNWYVEEYEKLYDTDYNFYKTVKLCLSDIVHDRGYQFYLPILRQQFRAQKNRLNIKTKALRGDYEDAVDEYMIRKIDEAMDWLADLTEKFLIKDNLDKIHKIKRGFVIKKYLDVENDSAVPIGVIIQPNGIALAKFLTDDNKFKTTSLYEIELLKANLSDKPILTDEKIASINLAIDALSNGWIKSFELDPNGSVINAPIVLRTVFFRKYTKHHLKSIEIFKLERLLHAIAAGTKLNFSVTQLPDIYTSDEITVNDDRLTISTDISFKLSEIGIETAPKNQEKYINTDASDRFIQWKHVCNGFIISPSTSNLNAPPYVKLKDNLIFGIVDTKSNIPLAKAISSLLSRSIEDAKCSLGGYLPDHLVERAQLEYVSPCAITNLWGRTGNRFVLLCGFGSDTWQLVGTALISQSRNNLFFFTSKYNNVTYPIHRDVDFNLTIDGKHKWFDRFDMPNFDLYKPAGFNQLANFAVEKIGCRGLGYGQLMINAIEKHYAYVNPNINRNHSQPLICGDGLFQIADPSWPKYMEKIGFVRRLGAETFFIEQPLDPLPKVIINRKMIDHVSYNKRFGLPQFYDKIDLTVLDPNIHLVDRIPHVRNLATNGIAKLQYFQLFYPFKNSQCQHHEFLN